ncbi:hypothetical protein G6F65_021465 [Rhizopus arrhizus]|nr:hypothetical protein G6F65_021465 [Rhizopus arrhizus]
MPAAQRGQLVRLHLSGFAAGHLVTAAGRAVEAAEDVHQRRLARTGLAHQPHRLAAPDVERHALDRRELLGRTEPLSLAHVRLAQVLHPATACMPPGDRAAPAAPSPTRSRGRPASRRCGRQFRTPRQSRA